MTGLDFFADEEVILLLLVDRQFLCGFNMSEFFWGELHVRGLDCRVDPYGEGSELPWLGLGSRKLSLL